MLNRICLLLLVAGCAPEDPSALDVRGQVAFDTEVPAVARVTLDGASGRAWIEHGPSPALGSRVDAAPVGEGHEARLVGLKPDRPWFWRPVVEVDGREVHGVVRTFDTPPLPDDLPPFRLQVRDRDRSEADDGWVLTSVFDAQTSYVVMIDGEGDVVWYVRDPGPPWKITRARLSLDGRSVLWSMYHRKREEDLGRIVRVALDGSSRTETRALEQHHDFVEHPDGTLAWLSWGYTEGTLRLGASGPIAYDIVREAPEGATDADEPRRAFDFLEDYPADPAWQCAHNTFDLYVPDHYEWTHANSIVHDPTADVWYVQVRYLDALLAIDRPTGALLWQLGGDDSDFEAVGDSELPLHGHLSEVWDGGLLMFDNQDHGRWASRVVEYAYDPVAGTVEEVWTYDDPAGRFSSHLGDARRLPGGNRLVSWSPFGELEEITLDGEVVWAVSHPWTVSRVTPVGGSSTLDGRDAGDPP